MPISRIYSRVYNDGFWLTSNIFSESFSDRTIYFILKYKLDFVHCQENFSIIDSQYSYYDRLKSSIRFADYKGFKHTIFYSLYRYGSFYRLL